MGRLDAFLMMQFCQCQHDQIQGKLSEYLTDWVSLHFGIQVGLLCVLTEKELQTELDCMFALLVFRRPREVRGPDVRSKCAVFV
jgi:hypothetical protein